MSLLSLLITLIVVGVLLYMVNRYIPMASSIKTILNVVVVVFVCIWLLAAPAAAQTPLITLAPTPSPIWGRLCRYSCSS